MSKEISSMEAGVGQKYGMVWFSMGVGLSGLIVAFLRGATLTAAYLGLAPLMLIATSYFAEIYMVGAQDLMKSYGQSAGYADQALNAIKTVTIFGQ